MAHTAPSSTPPRRKLEIALGVLVLLIGAGLVIVTVVALNHPKGRQAANATGTTTGSNTASSTASTSPSASTTPSKTASPSKTPPSSSKVTTSPASPTTSAAGAGKLPLVVLNNTSSTTATTAAQRFQAGGWTVTDTSTFAGDILSTAVYYDPVTPGAEAAANALQQQYPAIQRVKEKFDGLPAGPLVVVLTSDYS